MCPWPATAKAQAQGDMSPELFGRIISEIAAYPRLARLLLYLMNEPLMDPRLPERISIARQALPETEIYILTNGIDLDEKISKMLIESGLNWVGISFHAITPDTYRTITSRKDFSLILDRVTNFVKSAIRERDSNFIQVNITRMAPQVSPGEFEQTVDYFRRLGVRRLDPVQGYISRAGNIAVQGREPVHVNRASGCKTVWAYKMAHILFDGSVIPCCMDWRREVMFGNVGSQSLVDVWRSEARLKFLEHFDGRILPDNYLCSRCEDCIPSLETSETEKSACSDTTIRLTDSKRPDVLLLNPPPWLPDAPPLGLACLTADLRHRGLSVVVYDANIDIYSNAAPEQKHLWEWEAGAFWEQVDLVEKTFAPELDFVVKRILEINPYCIGISTSTCKLSFVAAILNRLKKQSFKIPIFLGGPGVHDIRDRQRIHSLAPGTVVGFIIGEGEKVFAEIVGHLLQGQDYSTLPGFALMNADGPAETYIASAPSDLDELPMPVFDDFNLALYKHPYLPIEFSRGCAGRCAFCNVPKLFSKPRKKSPERILDEMKRLSENYSFRIVSVVDPAANNFPANLLETCRLISKEKINLNWSVGISPNYPCSPDLLAAMKDAGCYRIEVGIESGSDRILKAMNRLHTSSVAGRILAEAKALDIQTAIYLIVGFPGETEKDLDLTIDFLEKNAANIDLVRSVNPCLALPESDLDINPADYEIDLSGHNHYGFAQNWRTHDNTPEERDRRVLHIMKAIDRLQIQREFFYLTDDTYEPAARLDRLKTIFSRSKTRALQLVSRQDDMISGRPKTKRTDACELLLVQCPVWGVEMPPLGISYLSEFARHAGFDPLLIDANIELFACCNEKEQALFYESNFRHWTEPDGFEKIWSSFVGFAEQLVRRILDSGRSVIGFSVTSPNRRFTSRIASMIKKQDKSRFVIVGGRGVDTESGRLMFPPDSVDAFVIGEGEVSLVALLEAIAEHRDPAELPGIVRYNGNQLTPLTPRPLMTDLGEIPYPTFEGLDLSLYTTRDLPLLMSRGCVKACTFCNDHSAMPGYRVRPPEHVAAEISSHAERYGAGSFRFNDQLINGDTDKLEKFCDLMAVKNLKIKFIALAAPSADMSFLLAHKLARAGCFTLNLGVESGSARVLRMMNKGFTAPDAEHTLRVLRSAGINTMINFIVGFPGETENDFEETLEFARRNRDLICGITSANTCLVLENSAIDLKPSSFGVHLPEDPMLRDHLWMAGLENTLQVRQSRLLRLLSLLKELGLTPLVSSEKEREADLDSLKPDTFPKHEPIYKTGADLPKQKEIQSKITPQPVHAQISSGTFAPMEPLKSAEENVALLLPPVWGADLAPLGISYLKAACEQAGIPIFAMDLNIRIYRRSLKPDLWRMESYKMWTDPEIFNKTQKELDPLIEDELSSLWASKVKVVGISCNTGNIAFARAIAKRIRIKRADMHIVLGGPAITNSLDPPSIGKSEADYLVFGEAEESFPRLLMALLVDREPENILGVHKVGDPLDLNSIQRPVIADLNSLSWPRFEKADLAFYRSSAIPILSSRGCVRRCSFCNDHHIYQSYRRVSPEKVLEQILWHKHSLNEDRFAFLDVLINGHPPTLEKLCELLASKAPGIRWGAQAIIREEMSLSLLKKMKKAGCESLVYGLESFSGSVLDAMKKPYSPLLAKKVLADTKRAGITTTINLLFGFPGETEGHFNETMRSLKENAAIYDEVASISPCLINLGSDLFDRYESYGVRFTGPEPSIKWEGKDGNTWSERRRRVEEAVRLLKGLNKPVHTVNLYDEASPEHKSAKENLFSSPQRLQVIKHSRQSRILLVLPPPWGVEFPPLGLALLSSLPGIEAEPVDLNIEAFESCGPFLREKWKLDHLKNWEQGWPFFEMLCSYLDPLFKQFAEKAASDPPLAIGISINEANFYMAIRLAEKILAALPEAIIILGGPGVRWDADRQRLPDFMRYLIVEGEGEEAFPEVVSALKAGRDPAGIPGTFAWRDGAWIAGPERRSIQDPDRLPDPNYSKLPLHLYTSFAMPLLFGRGCINACAFCNDHRFIPGYRRRTPERLLAEIASLKKLYLAHDFVFNDLILNADLPALRDFCRLAIARGVRMAFTGQAAIDPSMTIEDFKLLAQSGCSSLVFGIESFSDRVLKAMQKRFSAEQAKKILDLCKQAGIETLINLVVGFPGETEEDFRTTLEFIERNKHLIDKVSAVSTCIVTANSPLERNPERYRIILPQKNHWCLWRTEDDQNNYEIRAARLATLCAKLDSLGIPRGDSNLYLETSKKAAG